MKTGISEIPKNLAENGVDVNENPSTPDLGRLSPQELSELKVLYLEAQLAQMRYQHRIQLLLTARNLGFDVGVNMATGKFEVR